MHVDFLGGSVGNSPEVEPIATDAPVSLAEVCGNRARGTNDLIRQGLDGRNPGDIREPLNTTEVPMVQPRRS
jgi:hypothetical protein